MVRILVADDDARMQTYYRTILEAAGHEVVGAVATGSELVAACGRLHPDLVLSDVKMPDMDGIEAAEQIYQTAAIPVILVSAHHEQELIERALSQHVMAYLVKPIKQGDLLPAIAIAQRRFSEFEHLRKETADLRQALADRKVIEQAKRVLMAEARLDEPAAFRRLQKLASEKNRKLIDIAHMVLTAHEAMRPG